MLRGTNFSYFLKDLDFAIERVNSGTCFDCVHTSHIKNSSRHFHSLLCKFYNELISHTYNVLYYAQGAHVFNREKTALEKKCIELLKVF